jgi:hypothetical protein
VNARLEARRSTGSIIVSALAVAAAHCASAAPDGLASSASARIGPYLMANVRQEVALARTAAPPSLSMRATVMVLGAHGYFIAAKGRNRFVCLVVRSWDNAVSVRRATFWDPRFRVPYCLNAAAAKSVLPEYLMKTRWAIAGASRAQMRARERAAWAAGRLHEPTVGSICYMMSRRSWGVGGNPGPWRPHLMLYFPRARTPDWGANLHGNPVIASVGEHTTVVMILVPFWSDGSPAPGF